MIKYILKRIGYMLVTLLIITTVTFFMMHSIPGDPLGAMANKLPEQAKANYYAKYGLDKPLTEQYGIFMKNLITKGDLGESLKYPGKSITDTLLTNSKVSGMNGGIALLFGVTTGIVLGIVAALNKNKWPDYLVMFIAMLGITIPVFVLAAMLQYLFSVKWQILPTSGWGKPKHMILPIIAMCFGSIATYARYLKANMLDVMGQDYILTAEANGCQPLPYHQGPRFEECLPALYHHPGRTDFRYLHRLLRHRKDVRYPGSWFLLCFLDQRS